MPKVITNQFFVALGDNSEDKHKSLFLRESFWLWAIFSAWLWRGSLVKTVGEEWILPTYVAVFSKTFQWETWPLFRKDIRAWNLAYSSFNFVPFYLICTKMSCMIQRYYVQRKGDINLYNWNIIILKIRYIVPPCLYVNIH